MTYTSNVEIAKAAIAEATEYPTEKRIRYLEALALTCAELSQSHLSTLKSILQVMEEASASQSHLSTLKSILQVMYEASARNREILNVSDDD